MIDADPDLMAQVVINLLRNAADAATMNGDDPAISITIEALRGGRTRIIVADNGAGVPVDLRHDIFLPFFTTKKTGTGVGLPSSSTATIVKKQLLAWRTTWVRMFSAITLMPISIDEVPV